MIGTNNFFPKDYWTIAEKNAVVTPSNEGGEVVTLTGAIAGYTVGVPTLLGIYVSTNPTKLYYTVGERFDPTDMVVFAFYNDGTVVELPPDAYTWSPDGPLTIDDTDITISYTEGGITMTVPFGIGVEASNGGSTGGDSSGGGFVSFGGSGGSDSSDSNPYKIYSFIYGANGTWVKGSKDGHAFSVNASYNKLYSVRVDGLTVSKDNYTSKSGSTIVTLKPEYLETLSLGKHTVRILFSDGYAETRLTIISPSKDDPSKDNPSTGRLTHLPM